MHPPLIIGNWKMYGTAQKARDLAADLAGYRGEGLQSQMVVCPPFVYLPIVRHRLLGTKIALGAQDCHFLDQGPHTGDVGPGMLADIGCRYVILGHCERRLQHGETSALTLQKAEAAHKAGLCAVICIGETLSEREAGRTLEVLKIQWRASVPPGANALNTVIAYEPVWAIGTGLAPKPEDLVPIYRNLHMFALGPKGNKNLRILYGGSVKSENINDFRAIDGINGVLVGGASLDAQDFFKIAMSYN